MLSRKDEGRFHYIIKHCERIIIKTSNITENEFHNVEDIKEIVCFNVLQIGELVKGISDEIKNKYNIIPWKQIAGVRDRIVHGYDSISFLLIWTIVQDDIDDLKKNLEKILNENSFKKN